MSRPRQVSDEQILDAAAAVFLEHGPSVSTTVIADRLGVSQAALFKRFGTKDELMLSALLPPGPPAWIEDVRQGPRTGDLRAELRGLLSTLWGFVRVLAPRVAVLHQSSIDVTTIMGRYETPPPVLVLTALEKWFELANQRGIATVKRPEHPAMATFSSMHGLVVTQQMFGQPMSESDIEDYMDYVADSIARSVAPEEKP